MRSFLAKIFLACCALSLSALPAHAAINSPKAKKTTKPVASSSTVQNKAKKAKGVTAKAAKSKPAKAKAAAKSKTIKTAKQQVDDLKRQLAAQRKPSPKRVAKTVVAPRYQAADDQPSPWRGLSCRSAFIMDAETGKPLFDQAADLPGQPASTIKVVTGLIAIENLHDQDLIRTSSYAASMPRSKVYLKPGSAYPADDLINAVLLASANDASVALAERLAGSEDAFARLMTRKAQALGARNTICKSANGLTKPGQQSTARDLAVIFNHAMQNPEFAERMGALSARTSDGKTLRSHNKALWTVDGAVGGKTGYTDVARKTYVGKFQRGSQSIIVALMGSENMWRDIAALVERGFDLQQEENLRMASKQHPQPHPSQREDTRL
ncbi:MAG: D-alanyl-D-alanine carboxypeptidase family protein [Thermodesulfobacteriota bacterium]